jgi:hypothetical protein
MIFFLEFKMNEQTNITVNIGNILNIFENKEGKAVIVQSNEENFTVTHTYKEVLNMLTYFDEVKISNC